MQIQDLYDAYDLMPGLRMHQLRVGGIVRLITDDRDAVITALLHDMGNLAKFTNLDPAWAAKQVAFQQKYGSDANEATYQILAEAGLSKYLDFMREEGNFYHHIGEMQDYTNVCKPALLTLYADCRVAIDGVCTAEERVQDLERRYGPRPDREWVFKLEDYVQSQTARDVRTITEADVTPLFDELLTLTV